MVIMSNPRWSETTIIAVLREAGASALKERARLSSELKHDNSLVTSADRAIEQLLRDRLTESMPNTGFIGEESALEMPAVELQHALEGTSWVVDPIDGTAAYAQGLPTWGVSVGLMEGGRLLEGAIFVPVEDQLLMTSGDRLLYASALRSTRSVAPRLKEVSAPELPRRGCGMVGISQKVAKHGRFLGDGPVHAAASCVYSVMQLLLGRYSAYVASLKLWDIAAALPMLERLGYTVLFSDRTALGCYVTEADYVLDPKAHNAFALRDHVFIAPTERAARALINEVRLSKR